jgi:acetylornithine deacetylase/succinyl-diaminopimelate desuccinylase-like protein
MTGTDAATRQLIADAKQICAVPAPPFAESERGELVGQLFSAAGLQPRVDETGNVIAWIGPADRPAVVFAAHLDTVFPAGTPIEFAEHDDRVSAPGFGDNSVGVAALLHLARLVAGRVIERPIALVATVGEEGLGDLRGAKALLDHLDCRAFVAVEGQMLDAITVAGVGSVRMRVHVTGPGGHPWGNRDNANAAHGLVERLALALSELQAPELALNVNVLTAGTAINVLPDSAVAEIDLRCEDEARLQVAAARLTEIVSAHDPQLAVSVEQLGHRPGGRIPDDHPLLDAARRARVAAGLAPAAEEASSTDANAAHGRGIPAITVGVSTGGNAHRLDDYVDIGPIAAGLRSLEALALELAG